MVRVFWIRLWRLKGRFFRISLLVLIFEKLRILLMIFSRFFVDFWMVVR